MKTELVNIHKLQNNTGQIEDVPKNPRFIKDEKFKKLVQSIEDDPEMLELREVIAYDNSGELVVIAGNMRLRACKELRITEVPTKILPVETPKEKIRAYVIKDNNPFGENDMDMLANEWDRPELEAWGLDLPEETIEEDVEEDEAPEVDESEPPKSKLGEVYQLGRHRLMCGSATSENDVFKLMNGARADAVFTDPPYGNGTSGVYGRGELGHRFIEGDKDFSVVDNLLDMKITSVIIFFLQWRTFKEAIQALERNDMNLRTIAVWDKKNSGLGSGLMEQWEAILFAGDIKFSKFGGNVFTVSRENKKRIDSPHPHQKPIALLAEILEYLQDYKILLDPFGGSGSTLIACEKTNRTCFMMEVDPKYVDVIRKRYWKLINDDNEEGWEENTPAVEDN